MSLHYCSETIFSVHFKASLIICCSAAASLQLEEQIHKSSRIYLLFTFLLDLLGQNESDIVDKINNMRSVSLLQMHCIVSYLHIWPLKRATYYNGSCAVVFAFAGRQYLYLQVWQLKRATYYWAVVFVWPVVTQRCGVPQPRSVSCLMYLYLCLHLYLYLYLIFLFLRLAN